jgi:fructokinase
MLDVVCFGEILWDLFEGRPRGGERIARVFRRELGGASGNLATGLARLGTRVALVGGVGRDQLGDALVAHLRADRVDVRFIQKLPNRTGLTFVVGHARGRRQFVPYRHGSADLAVRAEHIAPGMGRARWACVDASALMTREFASATDRFVSFAESAGANVLVDLNVRPHLWPDRRTMRRAVGALAARAVLVKASHEDLRAIGERGDGLDWLERHARRATWIVTRGSGRASAIGAHGQVHERALRCRCVDVTGAGDAFLAGGLAMLVAARARPASQVWRDPLLWRAVLRAGHMMGKKAVSHSGAVAGLVDLGRIRGLVDRGHRSVG